MRKRVIVGVAVATVLAAAALAQGPDNKTLRAIGEGRGVYLVHCAGCHGADARGGTTGTNHVAAPDLTLIAVRDGSFDALHVKQHIDGRVSPSSDMPCWGNHFRNESSLGEANAATRVYMLTRYLDFVQGLESAPPVKR